jgi:hypothetical protein
MLLLLLLRLLTTGGVAVAVELNVPVYVVQPLLLLLQQ